jgi:hypothetical protein
MYVHGCFAFPSCLIRAPRHCPTAGPYTPFPSSSPRFSHTNMSSEPTQASSADAQMLDAAAALVAAHAEVGPNSSIGQWIRQTKEVACGTTQNY